MEEFSSTPVCAQSCCVRRGGKQMWRSLCMWKTTRKTLFTAHTITRTHAYALLPHTLLKTYHFPHTFTLSNRPFIWVVSKTLTFSTQQDMQQGMSSCHWSHHNQRLNLRPHLIWWTLFFLFFMSMWDTATNWKQQLCLAKPQLKCHVLCKKSSFSYKLMTVLNK